MYQLVLRFARRLAAKPDKTGIMQISNNQEAIDTANDILTKFKKHKVPNEAIQNENDVKVIYNQIINIEDQQLRRNIISPGDPRHKEVTERIFGKPPGEVVDMTGKKIDTSKPILGGKNVPEDVVTNTVIIMKKMTPMDAMKEANLVIARKGKYKNLTIDESQDILKKTNDHIFERDIKYDEFGEIIKPDPEDFAHGGRSGSGLNYLLGEDDQNVRMPFKKGHSAGRRKFLKVAAGLATIPIVGKYFKWAKPLAKSSKVLTSVPIKAGVDGMPVWFKPLVNQVIKKGDDVTKTHAYQDMQVVHKTKLPDSQTEVLVTQNIDTGDVVVDIGAGKHGWADGHLGQPVRLEYKAAEDILTGPDMDDMHKVGVREPQVKTKSRHEMSFDQKKHPDKTPEEFWVEEAEFTGGHPENVKFEESTFEKFGEHASNFDEVEKFATGKVKKSKPTKKKLQTEYESGKAEADADRWADDVDMASGGRVPFGGGYLAGGAKSLGKKYKGSTLAAILENPKLLGVELGHDGIMELMNFLPGLFSTGGRVPLAEGKTPSAEQLEHYYKELEEQKKRKRLQQELYEQRFGGPGPVLEAASGGLAGLLGE